MTRHQRIIEVYKAALDGRDAASVEVGELLPAIEAAVPDAELVDIVDALRASAKQDFAKAALERYGNAKFGNAGKQAEPGDGTIPFKPRS